MRNGNVISYVLRLAATICFTLALFDAKTGTWYPTVKLFRQAEFGKWEKPFSILKEALHARRTEEGLPYELVRAGMEAEAKAMEEAAKETACAQGS